ncbi:hypothetical protein C8R47DRAFT_1081041 [Mycena vitilis]|nr:hypothetical protein C8R47DRAFT_1081041 [Mycena vitilis]
MAPGIFRCVHGKKKIKGAAWGAGLEEQEKCWLCWKASSSGCPDVLLPGDRDPRVLSGVTSFLFYDAPKIETQGSFTVSIFTHVPTHVDVDRPIGFMQIDTIYSSKTRGRLTSPSRLPGTRLLMSMLLSHGYAAWFAISATPTSMKAMSGYSINVLQHRDIIAEIELASLPSLAPLLGAHHSFKFLTPKHVGDANHTSVVYEYNYERFNSPYRTTAQASHSAHRLDSPDGDVRLLPSGFGHKKLA